MPNCSAACNGRVPGICTAPDPTRIVDVAAAIWPHQHRRGRRCDPGHEVVLGHPVAVVPGPLRDAGQVDRVPQGVTGGAAGRHRRQVEDRQRERARDVPPGCADGGRDARGRGYGARPRSRHRRPCRPLPPAVPAPRNADRARGGCRRRRPRPRRSPMPTESEPLEHLGFLTIGSFDGDDPAAGHESTLQVIELGERLGFDSAFLRHRHLQYGISSPVAVLAAASQRTRGSSSAPPSPRWAGRTRCAWPRTWPRSTCCPAGGSTRVSRRPPDELGRVKDALYPDTADVEDFARAASSACCAWCAASRPRRSPACRASRCSPTGCSRTPPVSARGSGTARPAGLGALGGRAGHEMLTSSVVKAPRTANRTSPRCSGPDPRLPAATRTAGRRACPRASW